MGYHYTCQCQECNGHLSIENGNARLVAPQQVGLGHDYRLLYLGLPSTLETASEILESVVYGFEFIDVLVYQLCQQWPLESHYALQGDATRVYFLGS